MVRAAIYFDTSGSMWQKIDGVSRIDLARQVWEDVRDRFDGQYSKISTINGKGDSVVLAPLRKRNIDTLRHVDIPDPGGGTYLWGFLIEEAKQLIQTSSEWVFFIITDGGDVESEGEYYGIEGFVPCAKKIKEIGIDAEFKILGLGLTQKVANSFRKLAGETGGYFDNIESSSDIEESVERLDETLSEMGDAEARERRRASRHRDYLSTTTESERPTLGLIETNAERKLSYGGRVETLSTISPAETIDWLEDLLRIRGHVNTLRADSGEFWFEVESELPQNEIIEGVHDREDCWAIDSEKLTQSLAAVAVEPEKVKLSKKLKNFFLRKPEAPKKKPKSVHDILFELNDDIRKASKEARKKIIFRGDEFPEDYFGILNSGLNDVKVMIYPTILPPPPPPSFDVGFEEYKDWLKQMNPSREEWLQFPRDDHHESSITSELRKAVIVDSIVNSEHIDSMISQIDTNTEFRKLKIAVKKSPFTTPKPIDVGFLSIESSRAEYKDWSEKHMLSESEQEIVDQFITYNQIVVTKILTQYLKLQGMKPKIVVFRFCDFGNDLNLQSHPFFAKIVDLFEDLQSRVAIENNANKGISGKPKWEKMQIDSF